MKDIILYLIVGCLKIVSHNSNSYEMSNINTILASSLVSTVLASVFSLILINLKYNQEYKKLIIERRLDIYNKIESILESISLNHKNEIILLATDISSYNKTKTYIKTIISKSYLMSEEISEILMELSLKLNEYDKYFIDDFENIKRNIPLRDDLIKIQLKMSKTLKKDYKNLHKI